jgi:hypothetical protein
MNFRFRAKLFRYTVEPASWYFIETSKDLADRLKQSATHTKGFGFIPVEATVGKTTWRTTFFPTKQKTYLLSVKALVRRKEDIREGDVVTVKGKLI